MFITRYLERWIWLSFQKITTIKTPGKLTQQVNGSAPTSTGLGLSNFMPAFMHAIFCK